MRIPGTNAHLTYCLNVHSGGTLAEAETAIFEHAPKAFAEFSRLTGVKGPYGLGIWLSARAVRALNESWKNDAFSSQLEHAGFYPVTFNAFPYGRFHGTRVKQEVYRPDWADEKRFEYTMALTTIVSEVLRSNGRASISTLPITFKPWADEERVYMATNHLAEVAGQLRFIQALMNTDIALALEPEPGCYLERTDDVIRYFKDKLLPHGREVLAEECSISEVKAEAALRRHIGVCLDTVHTGVMGEDPKEALRKYAAAGIRVAKVQLGAALRIPVGPEGPPPALRAFQDEVYLHQTVVATPDGQELYFNDLPDALGMDPPPQGEWRVHFHVPLAWPGEGSVGTTAGQVDAAFLAAALAAGCEHFESEIYTLDVFPAAKESREAILAQDLAWLWQLFQEIVGSPAS